MARFLQIFLFCFVIGSLVATECDHKSCTDCVKAHCSWCADTNACQASFSTDFTCHWSQVIRSPVYECPSPPPKDFPYNDTFVRRRAFPAIAAAAAMNAQPCLTNALDGAVLKRQLTVSCDIFKHGDTCSGYTAVSPADRAIIVSFRGTNGAGQLFLEIIEAAADEKVSFHGGGKVAKYFYQAFRTLWDAGMKDDLITLKADPANAGYDLWVVGHSLGGSMAAICAAAVVDLGMFSSDQVKMITIGQPRTGDISFAEAHDRLVPHAYRIIHAQDIVPHIPPKTIDPYLYHHRFEVWYNNGMLAGQEYELCERPDDNACSASNADLSITDHVHYFGVEVSDFGEAGCVYPENVMDTMKNAMSIDRKNSRNVKEPKAKIEVEEKIRKTA